MGTQTLTNGHKLFLLVVVVLFIALVVAMVIASTTGQGHLVQHVLSAGPSVLFHGH